MPEMLPQTKPRSVVVRVFVNHRFLLLFLFLLASLIAYPYTENSGFGFYAFRVLTGGIIALSVLVGSFRRGLAVVALLLAIPASVQHLLHPNLTAGFLPVVNMILSFAFDLWILIAIFRR